MGQSTLIIDILQDNTAHSISVSKLYFEMYVLANKPTIRIELICFDKNKDFIS